MLWFIGETGIQSISKYERLTIEKQIPQLLSLQP
jgi:hypothetical protein